MNKSRISKINIFSAIVFCLLTIISFFAFTIPSNSVYALPQLDESLGTQINSSSQSMFGISLKTPFVLSYVKDEKIDFNGSQTKTMPNLQGGKLSFYYSTSSNKSEIKEVDILQSALNYVNDANNASVDRISVANFSTETVRDSKLTLTYYPANETVSYDLEIAYRVFENSSQLSSAKKTTEILLSINSVLNNILVPVIIVVLSAGVVFAIYLGFKMARAKNADQRDEAKKRVVYTVIAIAVGVALILLFKLFASNSLVWFGTDASFFQLGK